MKNKLSLIFATFIFLLGSCASSKKVPYMIDAESIPQETLNKIVQNVPTTALPGDLLEITVLSFNIDAVRPFNKTNFINEISRT